MEKLKKYIKSTYLPFVILFFLMLIVHIKMDITIGDYVYFNEMLDKFKLSEFLKMRYKLWSSRILIEAFLVSITKCPVILWKVMDSLCITLIGMLISRLFVIKNKRESNYIIVFLILMYSLNDMASAGWLATMINYMWPLMFTLASFIPIKNYLNNNKNKIYMYPVYIFSLFFACNQEQTACIVFGVYLLFLLYMIKNKKIDSFCLILLILSLLNLIFILLCPGNAARSSNEILVRFPEYKKFHLIQKLNLGLISLFGIYVRRINLLLLSFILMLYMLCAKNKKLKYICFIPILIMLVLNYLRASIIEYVPFVNKFYNLFIEFNIKKNVIDNNIYMWISSFIAILFFGIIIYLLYKIQSENKCIFQKYFLVILLLIGIASRLIMGFSPTIFVSGNRTNLFMEFSLVILVVLLWQLKDKDFSKRNICLFVICLFGLIRYSSFIISYF